MSDNVKLDELKKAAWDALKAYHEKLEEEAEEQGYNRGCSETLDEMPTHPFDSDDVAVLRPILDAAYQQLITEMPWKAKMVQRLIDYLEGDED